MVVLNVFLLVAVKELKLKGCVGFCRLLSMLCRQETLSGDDTDSGSVYDRVCVCMC